MTEAGRIGPDRSGRWLLVGGGRIRAVGQGPPPREVPVLLTCDDGHIEPGRVNAHTHVYSALAPFGMPEPEPPPATFLEILERLWWRLDRALDEETLGAGARLYAAEALLAGTTGLIDHHESPSMIEGSLDILAAAFDELGIRAVLCYGATERNGGRGEARRGLAECERFLRRPDHPLMRGMVGLHASFTVSDETIREAGEACRRLGVPLHLHVAEDGADVADARRRGYEGPVERLRALGGLPPGSILAHGVHLTEEQVAAVDEAGAWIVQNPRSNRGNRVGYGRNLWVSSHVALGTDGYPADMVAEEAALREEARRQGDRLEAALARPAASRSLLGRLFDETFDLVEGAPADLVVRSDRGVEAVFVAGRQLVGGGRLLQADLGQLRHQAQAAAPALWRRMQHLAAEEGPCHGAART